MSNTGEWTPWQFIVHGAALMSASALDIILRNSREWSEVRQAAFSTRNHVDVIRRAIIDIRENLMALTAQQSATINELATGLNTLSSNLDAALGSAATVRDELKAMSEEDDRDQAEVDRLTALVAQMDTDVLNALTPLVGQVQGMNDQFNAPHMAPTGTPPTP